MNVDDGVDLDSSVELDGSEAHPRPRPRRCHAPSRLAAQGSVDVQRRGWAPRRTSPSTSTLRVNDPENPLSDISAGSRGVPGHARRFRL